MTNDKITKVRITPARLSYTTVASEGFIECDAVGIMIEHLKTLSRAEGKATTERKLIDRIFHGESLGLYTIGLFEVNVML